MQDSHFNNKCKESTTLAQPNPNPKPKPNPDSDDSWLQKGVSLIFANQFDQAIALFQEKIEQAEGKQEQREHAQRAEAFFLLAKCYDVMFCPDQLDEYLKKTQEAVRLAYPEDESQFRFHPLLRLLAFNEGDFADDLPHLLTCFIEQNNDSHLSHLGRMFRQNIFFHLKLTQEAEEDFRFLTDLYPNSVISHTSKIFMANLTGQTFSLLNSLIYSMGIAVQVMEHLDYIEALIPKSYYFLEFKGYQLYKNSMSGLAIKAWQESLHIKTSRCPLIYAGLLTSLSEPGRLADKVIYECLDRYIKDVPAVILEAVKNLFPKVVELKNLTPTRPIISKSLLSLGRYGGLCLFEMGRFDEAIIFFQHASEAVFDAPSWGDHALEIEEIFNRLKAECRDKIEECKIQIIRRTSATRKIHRSLLEAVYRPGGSGYYAAEEHFNMLKAQR